MKSEKPKIPYVKSHNFYDNGFKFFTVLQSIGTNFQHFRIYDSERGEQELLIKVLDIKTTVYQNFFRQDSVPFSVSALIFTCFQFLSC